MGRVSGYLGLLGKRSFILGCRENNPLCLGSRPMAREAWDILRVTSSAGPDFLKVKVGPTRKDARLRAGPPP